MEAGDDDDVVQDSPVKAARTTSRVLADLPCSPFAPRFARRALATLAVSEVGRTVEAPSARRPPPAAAPAAAPAARLTEWQSAASSLPQLPRSAGGASGEAQVLRQGGLLPLGGGSFSRIADHRKRVPVPAGVAVQTEQAVVLPAARRLDVPAPHFKPAEQTAAPTPPEAPAPEPAQSARQVSKRERCPDATPADRQSDPPPQQEEAVARPNKRPRAPAHSASARGSSLSEKPAAARKGGSRGNFVKLQLGKGKRFAGSGGRKFVNGAGGKSKKHSKFFKKRPVFADSAAAPAPLMVDDTWATARLPSNADAAPAPPPPAPPPPPSAEVLASIEAAQVGRSTEQYEDVLRHVFGFSAFREGQLEVIEKIMSGRSSLTILPTGQGKSLCYQFAALLLPGVTLVVSPLVALMDDQLAHLPPALPGAVLHSGQSPEQACVTLDALRAGRLKVLFVAPERLLSRRFLQLAAALPAHARLTFACVDECHCVSEWSHNFRPAYHRLGRALRVDLGVRQVLALTATATRRTEAAVAANLGIKECDILRNACVRQNLRLTVSREADRERALLSLLRPRGRLERTKCVIAYCTYKAEADRLAQFLFTNGVPALSYHAGKLPAERSRTQALFLNNKVRVIAATVAFGMGLDKPDVGAVVNFGLPHSIEAYVQQIGRGGRDGSVAQCHTFIDDGEYLRLRSLAFSDGVDDSALLNLVHHIFPPEAVPGTAGCIVTQLMSQELDMRLEAIETVLSYLQLDGCLPEQPPFLGALPDIRATLNLAFHKSGPEALAARVPLVQKVLELGKQRMGRYVVGIPQLASALGISFTATQEGLQELAATGEVSFTLHDHAVCYQVLHVPADPAALAGALAARLGGAERCQVGKLDALYSAVAAAVLCKEPAEQEAVIRTDVAAYFEAAVDADGSHPPALVKQTSNYLTTDIRALLRQGRDTLTTSRSVARVLHGLQSSHVSADVWRKNPAWGRHAAVDFQTVLRVAAAELAAATEKADT